MNDETKHDRIEPQLEARVVALVLGEASDFEAEQLAELFARQPELDALYRELQSLHALMPGAATRESVDANETWKLPAGKRDVVLNAIAGESNPTSRKNPTEPTSPIRRSTDRWLSSVRQHPWRAGVLAATLLVMTGFGLTLTMVSRQYAMRGGTSQTSMIVDSLAMVEETANMEWGAPASTSESSPRSSSSRSGNVRNSIVESVPSATRPAAPFLIDGPMSGGMGGGMDSMDMDSMDIGKGMKIDSPADAPVMFDSGTSQRFGFVSPPRPPMRPGSVATLRAEMSKNQPESRVIANESLSFAEPEQPRSDSLFLRGSASPSDDAAVAPQSREFSESLGVSDKQERPSISSRFSKQGIDELRRQTEVEALDAVGRIAGQPNRLGDFASKKKAAAKSESGRESSEGMLAEQGELGQTNFGSGVVNGRDSNLFLDGLQLGRSSSTALEKREEQQQLELKTRGLVLRERPAEQDAQGLVRAAEARANTRQIVETNETLATNEPFSTFSLHVSDVSFKLAAAALGQGQWPDAAKIRIEEFVNALDYGDPMPSRGEKVACEVEQAVHPFLQQRNLLRVSMRTAAAGRAATTPLRLTCLLDNSGSMERFDRQETVRRAFALLADQLNPNDQITLISFARNPRLLADRVTGAEAARLVRLIDELPSEGGTNLEAALSLAFEKANEQYTPGAQNRIVLLTDGAVNLGNADPQTLSRMILSMRDSGIAFDAAGIVANGLSDDVLETLTRQGDGRYYLLDTAESADEGFAKQIAGALRPSAKNVKVQIEFNPKRVGRYRLMGFEKHRLNPEDFKNDAIDAAEMAAEEAGVAVYQFESKPDGEGDVGSVSVRFRDLSSGRMVENRWPIPYQPSAPRLDEAEPAIQIASVAALLAAKLRGEALGDQVELRELARIMSKLPERNRNGRRVEQLQQMILQAMQIDR